MIGKIISFGLIISCVFGIYSRTKKAVKLIKEIKSNPKEMEKLNKMYKEQTGRKLK